MTASTLYDFTTSSIRGDAADFTAQRGKVFLLVNTASACGFTPQFAGLEQLWSDYKDRGLVVVGFPCNQFGHQDPGANSEIESFCQLNYGVSFPMMAVSLGLVSTYAFYAASALVSFFFVRAMVHETRGMELEQMKG